MDEGFAEAEASTSWKKKRRNSGRDAQKRPEDLIA